MELVGEVSLILSDSFTMREGDTFNSAPGLTKWRDRG